jgi:lipopolysaccharide/colanic/teichoic acid biosynthesis glycosyltransferase
MPRFILIAFFVWIKIGRPILFSQIGPGLEEKPFKVHKFRTMINAFDSKGNLLPDGDPLIDFGCFLGRFSLDEKDMIMS